ncbi:hypothetical protein CASFOL_010642 [Castilleja foliolosa]|uniref:Uncharacterized protein n=1 Tax=Castilleja foliolosa TaxID=1961234 RepID=A0ABD3DTT8_9LAMI
MIPTSAFLLTNPNTLRKRRPPSSPTLQKFCHQPTTPRHHTTTPQPPPSPHLRHPHESLSPPPPPPSPHLRPSVPASQSRHHTTASTRKPLPDTASPASIVPVGHPLDPQPSLHSRPLLEALREN